MVSVAVSRKKKVAVDAIKSVVKGVFPSYYLLSYTIYFNNIGAEFEKNFEVGLEFFT